MIVFIILIQALFFGLITAFMAGQKGYDIFAAYFVGMAIGPLGLLASLLPKKKATEAIMKELDISMMAA